MATLSREQALARLSYVGFSNSVKVVIHKMVDLNPAKRPTCKRILKDFLVNDGELERKFLRLNLKNLTNQLQTLEATLKVKRKVSS